MAKKSAKPVEQHPLTLTLQFSDKSISKDVSKKQIKQVVQAALFFPAELTIRFVDAEEGRILNRDYRGKDYATNVLTFAYTENQAAAVTLADIVLCSDVLREEAKAQGKSLESHTLHLIVHGVLHAQGYDHETKAEAEEMEQLEVEILAGLSIANPYQFKFE